MSSWIGRSDLIDKDSVIIPKFCLAKCKHYVPNFQLQKDAIIMRGHIVYAVDVL